MSYKKSAITRKRIMDVTRELILEKGWKEISVRDIAERAGVKNPLLYYYFKNKQDIADHFIGSLILKCLDFAEKEVPFEEDSMLSHFIYVTLYYRIITEKDLYKALYMESMHPFQTPMETEDDYDLNYMVKKQFQGITEDYNVGISQKYLTAYAISAFSIATSIMRNYISGNLELDFDESITFLTRFWIVSLGIDEKIYRQKLDQALEIARNVDIDDFTAPDEEPADL
ncbi:MAG TPA: hypothetical protein DHN33_12060 [Eubacteriaceae bacterium]|nr:hypothetical protein [Eubacteriaceae bacterium]